MGSLPTFATRPLPTMKKHVVRMTLTGNEIAVVVIRPLTIDMVNFHSTSKMSSKHSLYDDDVLIHPSTRIGIRMVGVDDIHRAVARQLPSVTHQPVLPSTPL